MHKKESGQSLSFATKKPFLTAKEMKKGHCVICKEKFAEMDVEGVEALINRIRELEDKVATQRKVIGGVKAVCCMYLI